MITRIREERALPFGLQDGFTSKTEMDHILSEIIPCRLSTREERPIEIFHHMKIIFSNRPIEFST
jgi:hypothetical protein